MGLFATAVTSSSPVLRDANLDSSLVTELQTSIERQRSIIEEVPGTGTVRGVWVYDGDVYAFRDNDTGTACKMYKSSTSGWVEQTMGTYIEFQDGTIEVFPGDVIEGATSGALGTVVAVNLINAGFQASNGFARGRIYISDTTGTFQDEETFGVRRVKFDTGTREILVGDRVTGSGASEWADVSKVVLDSGAWSSGDAAGYLQVSNWGQLNDIDDDEVLSVNGTQHALADGADQPKFHDCGKISLVNTTVSLSPGGYFEFVNYNFRGQEDTNRMYGADGVNPAFEFDGTRLMSIRTGADDSTPVHIAAHKFHLFLSVPGGSIFHSAPGKPMDFDSATDGAAEIAMGEEVTGFSKEVEDVFTIFTRNDTYFLYGSSVLNWALRRFHQGSGAIARTVQKIERTWYLDDRGITNISAVQAFGDFQQAVSSDKIQPLLESYINKVQCSLRVRKKNQYRLYFTDKTGISLTFINRKNLGILPFSMDHQVNVMCSSEDNDGNEVLYGGFDDGYVRKLDSGTSFDGEEVSAFVRTAFYNYETPHRKKRFRGLVIELDVESSGTINILPDFNYGKIEIPEALPKNLAITTIGDFWGSSNWSVQSVGVQVVEEARLRTNGIGTNMGMVLYTSSTYETPITLQGAVVEYSDRGLKR